MFDLIRWWKSASHAHIVCSLIEEMSAQNWWKKNLDYKKTAHIYEEKRTIALWGKKSIRKMHSTAVQGCSRASERMRWERKKEMEREEQTNKFYIEVEPRERKKCYCDAILYFTSGKHISRQCYIVVHPHTPQMCKPCLPSVIDRTSNRSIIKNIKYSSKTFHSAEK